MHTYRKTTLLACLISYSLCCQAGEGFNFDFIHGGIHGKVLDVFSNSTVYPAGEYVVDVIFNKDNLGKQIITITKDDRVSLCLSKEWIEKARLPIKLELFKSYFDKKRECYNLGNFPSAKVDFDYGSQNLKFSIPQVAVVDKLSEDNWDYGIPGAHLLYSGNVSKTATQKEQIYGNFELNANLGRWVLSGRTSAFNGQGFNTPEATLSTAIGAIRGSVLIGKSLTSSTLLPDFGFYGVSLRSDSDMVPWSSRGYAPVISGVANSNARITVSQGGYIISSQIVPPGAYSLKNIYPVGNGDITVKVEEDGRVKSVRTYPVTTLPTLLRANDFNYNMVVGTKTDNIGSNNNTKGIFTLASLDYGFEPVTVNSAFILHSKYQSAGIGLTKDFGIFGAAAASVNASRSKFNDNVFNKHNDNAQTGVSALLKYAKGISDTTNLQLLTYRYTGEKYIDFSEFDPRRSYYGDSRKERYEAIVTQSFGSNFVSASVWEQTYRGNKSNDIGANLNYSTVINNISLSINANYGKYSNTDNMDYGGSFSVGIPFSAFGHSHYSTSSIGYSNTGKTMFNTGVSGSVNDKVSYALNSSVGKHITGASAYAGIKFDPVQTGMSISQNEGRTSMSVSVSGSVIATKPSGILFTREQNNTVAVIKLKDIPNVSFSGSAPTDKYGNTVLSVTPYNMNDIRINTENVPENIELMNSVYGVVPTKRAIIYREFKHIEMKRYILQLLDKNGVPIVAGSQAKTEQGLDAGFTSQGGILLVNVVAAPKLIKVYQPNGQICSINMKNMIPNENETKGVHCE